MILKSIRQGFRLVWKNKVIILIYYLTTIFFALFVTLFFSKTLSAFLGKSLESNRFFESFDVDIVFEFLKNNSDSISLVFLLFILLFILNRLFLLFLSGGAFAVFASERRFAGKEFWGYAAKFSGRFLRLMLWALPFFFLFLLIPQFYNYIERLIFGKDPYQNIAFLGGWIKVGLRYLMLFIFGLLLDYSRIYTVVVEEKKMRLSIASGLNFIYNNFISVFLIALFLALSGIVGFLIYIAVLHFIPASNFVIGILVFLIQQIYFLFRASLKLTLFASQMNYFKARTNELNPVLIAENKDL